MIYFASLVGELHGKHDEICIKTGSMEEVLLVAGDITHNGSISGALASERSAAKRVCQPVVSGWSVRGRLIFFWQD